MDQLHQIIQSSIGYQSGSESSGTWAPLRDIHWSLTDSGPMHGAILVERLRTFSGKPFLVARHAQRFYEGANALGISVVAESDLSQSPFAWIANELVERNRKLIQQVGDVGLVVLLSPGDSGWNHHPASVPTWLAHLTPIPWGRLHGWYQQGCHLHISSVRNVPPDCWRPSIKSRSRLHYYLADRQATSTQPGSVAVLLNGEGNVTETSVANIIVVDHEGRLLSPRTSDILLGVSLEVVSRLAVAQGRELAYTDISVADLKNASELLMVGTTGCIWPAVSIDKRPIGNGEPGPAHRQLRQDWIDLVEFDFVDDARLRVEGLRKEQ